MKNIFKHLKGYYPKVFLVIALVFGNVLATLFLPNLMSQIVDIGITQRDIPYILRTGGIMLVVSILGSICTVISGLYASRIAASVASDLREKVFSNASRFSLNEFDTFGTSSLITRSTNDITQIQQVIVMGLRMMMMAPLMLIGSVVMAVSKNLSMSAVLLVTAPTLIISVAIIGKIAFPKFEQIQKKIDKINLIAREKLSGVRVIRAFVTDKYEEKRFDTASSDLTNSTIQVNRLMMTMMPLLSFILNATIIAVLWLGATQISNGSLLVGDLMAYIQYVQQILMSFVMLSMMVVMIPRAGVSMQRIQDVIDTKNSITTPKEPKENHTNNFDITFQNVSFKYQGAERPAVENISFTAKTGETTAIIGSTGSGKSTVIKLIPRLYDTTQGNVSVGGIDVKEYDPAYLRKQIGYVPQKAVLFSGDIASNVRYGKEEATEEEVTEAIEVAQASNFVFDSPEGLTRPISQGGTNVSGGQKQRLCIARALVRKPSVYVFDDSFSALDYKTDAALRGALKQVTQDSVVIIVAQRVSTIMDADKILVMDQGKLVGMGTHSELLQSCDVYLEIAKSQLGEEVAL